MRRIGFLSKTRQYIAVIRRVLIDSKSGYSTIGTIVLTILIAKKIRKI